MKKLLVIILTLSVLIVALLTSCEEKTVKAKRPVDVRFTAAHDDVITDYHMVGDYWIPDTYTVHCSDKYWVKYLVTYEDETSEYRWIEVTKDEYILARDKLP